MIRRSHREIVHGVAYVEADSVPDDLILCDATVLTMDGSRRAYRAGYVWLRGSLLHAVGPMAELDVPAGAEVRSLPGHVVLPGLVNAHGHLSNALFRGIFDELPLEQWMEADVMWNALRAIDGAAARAGAAASLFELMRQGVTTTSCGEFSTPHRDWADGVLEAAREAGVRLVLTRMTIDNDDPAYVQWYIPDDLRETPAQAIAEVERLRATYGSDLIEIGPEPLGCLWCTERTIRELHEYAVDRCAPFQMHLSDSAGEEADARAIRGCSPVQAVDRVGGLGPRTTLAHVIAADGADIRLLAERGTGVSHNPVANGHYAAGIAPLADQLEAGVRVGLGVDGASTNNSQNLWETAKVAIFTQKQLRGDAMVGSAELALELLTIGGARALHLDDRIGSLEPGKQADVCVIDARRPSLVPYATIQSSLVYAHDRDAVRSVFVAGEEVVRDGEHQRLDPGAVVEAAEREAARVLDRFGLLRLFRERSRFTWS